MLQGNWDLLLVRANAVTCRRYVTQSHAILILSLVAPNLKQVWAGTNTLPKTCESEINHVSFEVILSAGISTLRIFLTSTSLHYRNCNFLPLLFDASLCLYQFHSSAWMFVPYILAFLTLPVSRSAPFGFAETFLQRSLLSSFDYIISWFHLINFYAEISESAVLSYLFRFILVTLTEVFCIFWSSFNRLYDKSATCHPLQPLSVSAKNAIFKFHKLWLRWRRDLHNSMSILARSIARPPSGKP